VNPVNAKAVHSRELPFPHSPAKSYITARALGVSDVLAIDDDEAIEKFQSVDAIADGSGQNGEGELMHIDDAPGPLKIIMQRNQAITFDKPLASGDLVIYQRNGVALRVSKKMLALAGEYQKTGVEPFRGQLICEPMRGRKPKPYLLNYR
jgi:hypothetical protein